MLRPCWSGLVERVCSLTTSSLVLKKEQFNLKRSMQGRRPCTVWTWLDFRPGCKRSDLERGFERSSHVGQTEAHTQCGMPLLFHLPTRFLDMGDFWQGHVPYPEGNGIIYLFLNSSQVEYLCQELVRSSVVGVNPFLAQRYMSTLKLCHFPKSA